MPTKPKVFRRASKDAVTGCRHSAKELYAVARKVMEVRYDWYDYDDRSITVQGKSYRVLGQGCERTAVALCRYHVLKASAQDYQNRPEVEFFLGASPKVRRFLAPIYAYDEDFRWTLMRRARPYSSQDSGAYEFEDKMERLGVYDVHTGNIGFFGKRLVVFDYGSTESESDSWFGSDSEESCTCTACR